MFLLSERIVIGGVKNLMFGLSHPVILFLPFSFFLSLLVPGKLSRSVIGLTFPAV